MVSVQSIKDTVQSFNGEIIRDHKYGFVFTINDTQVSCAVGASLCYAAELWDYTGDIVPFNTIAELRHLLIANTYHRDL